MSYLTKKVQDASDIELLAELIGRNSSGPLQHRTVYACDGKDYVIGIGKDHTASIRLFDDAYEALTHLVADNGTEEARETLVNKILAHASDNKARSNLSYVPSTKAVTGEPNESPGCRLG